MREAEELSLASYAQLHVRVLAGVGVRYSSAWGSLGVFFAPHTAAYRPRQHCGRVEKNHRVRPSATFTLGQERRTALPEAGPVFRSKPARHLNSRSKERTSKPQLPFALCHPPL